MPPDYRSDDSHIRRIPSSASPAPFATPSPPPRSLTSAINSSFSTLQDTELQWRNCNGDSTPEEEDEDGHGRDRAARRKKGKRAAHDDEEWHLANTRLGRFWGNNISITVPGESARDHLALERTYLAYHRTSLVLALFSVIIAQLQVLQHAAQPDKTFGFYVLGKPLAGLFAGMAILVSVVGVLRWWRLQHGLLRGVGIGGGWEIVVVGGGIAGAVVVVFVLILAVGIRKTYMSD